MFKVGDKVRYVGDPEGDPEFQNLGVGVVIRVRGNLLSRIDVLFKGFDYRYDDTLLPYHPCYSDELELV